MSLLLFPINLIYSRIIKIELKNHFILDQGQEIVGRPNGMAVDDNEYFFVTDSALHNIKIYDNTGRLLRTFGRKGAGPGEFMDPYTIDCYKNKFCVQDVGHYKYFVFDNSFREITRFFYLVDGYGFILRENEIISNDYYKENERDFRGIILDFHGKVIRALMPIEFSQNDGWNRITASKAFVDVSIWGDIYFVKERETKFYKYDKYGKFIKNFGIKPSLFIPCQETKDFEYALYTTAPDRKVAWDRWRRSYTWVSGLFVMEDFLGIVIRKYNRTRNVWECFIQFYDLEGNPLGQDIMLKEPGTSSEEGFFLDSNHKDRIYILEAYEEEEPQYKIYRYILKKE